MTYCGISHSIAHTDLNNEIEHRTRENRSTLDN
jgi:hypothetical protein